MSEIMKGRKETTLHFNTLSAHFFMLFGQFSFYTGSHELCSQPCFQEVISFLPEGGHNWLYLLLEFLSPERHI